MKLLGHKRIDNTLVYINLENAIFKTSKDDEFTARVAHNVKEACDLIEVGFQYVTGGTRTVAKSSGSESKIKRNRKVMVFKEK